MIIKNINVFHYHSYRLFLKDVIDVAKSERKFSLRSFSKLIGISPSYLSLIISGQRDLSQENALGVCKVFSFSESETNFFIKLVNLSDTEDGQVRAKIFKELLRYKEFKEEYSNDLITFSYLTKWYYVAIREMSLLKGFKKEAKWIKNKLKKNVSLEEVKNALKFLEEKDFFSNTKEQLDCEDGIFRLSLVDFHHQILDLAHESIDKDHRKDRLFLGHTLALDKKNKQKAFEILRDALTQIKELSQGAAHESENDEVLHLELMGFPLTK